MNGFELSRLVCERLLGWKWYTNSRGESFLIPPHGQPHFDGHHAPGWRAGKTDNCDTPIEARYLDHYASYRILPLHRDMTLVQQYVEREIAKRRLTTKYAEAICAELRASDPVMGIFADIWPAAVIASPETRLRAALAL